MQHNAGLMNIMIIVMLCRFHCCVADKCALPHAVALVDRQVVCAEVVGATSSESFLAVVDRVHYRVQTLQQQIICRNLLTAAIVFVSVFAVLQVKLSPVLSFKHRSLLLRIIVI